MKNFKNDLIENLIDYHIDITDFNVIKPFIIESIESVWKGNVQDLKSYLAEQNQCSVGDIENLLERSNSRNWPAFFRSENNRRSEDFQAKNSLQLGRVVFLDNEREEKRRRFKELKFCVLHHLKRSFECNDTGKCNALYHISRIGLGCCWYSAKCLLQTLDLGVHLFFRWSWLIWKICWSHLPENTFTCLFS